MLTNKKNILNQAKTHISQVTEDILAHKAYIESSIQNLRKTLQKGESIDPEILLDTLIYRLEEKQQFEYSFKTPYFVRCDIKLDNENKTKTLYFGRFPFTQASIYSWVSPASTIRFENPGRFSYSLPSGEELKGELLRKDQFLIVDRKIIFMSTESIDSPRDLIYQEYFSEQKTDFTLREIVEQMEKAQDKIIRSHYFGSFLIAGAAGSGKTTLALHRVAYLLQSPDTQSIFKQNTIIVFVQDALTKQYFSGLLPQLGINNVKIVTFDEWAMSILDITGMQFINNYGKTTEEKDLYEYSKKKALKSLTYSINEKGPYKILYATYKNVLSPEQFKLFEKQINECLLDRFDLTILLRYQLKRNSKLFETVDKFIKQKSTGKYIKRTQNQEIEYSLIVLDEAENYLKEQIQILKSCINSKTQAIIYVGDLVQQTVPWAIKDWSEVNEQFEEKRNIELQKVYRNTKQILEYIKFLGYETKIPSKIREGNSVVEKEIAKKSEEKTYIKGLLKTLEGKTVGILAVNEDDIADYKRDFLGEKNIFCMTIKEAQGVEFDTVILVGMNYELFKSYNQINEEIIKEKQKVIENLIYVALTRAINNLYICGNTKLSSMMTP